MSLDIENTGFCIFGADPDATPSTSASSTPAAALGAKFPPTGALCTVLCKYKGGAKIEKGTGAGKGGAKQTFSGTKVGEVTVKIGYADREPTKSLMMAGFAVISPHGANKGKAWDWTEEIAGLYSIGAVMVEEMEGPDPTAGSDERTLTLKLSGWDKTQQANSGAGSGTTPTASQKYTVPGTPGQGLGGVTFPSKPEVVPNP